MNFRLWDGEKKRRRKVANFMQEKPTANLVIRRLVVLDGHYGHARTHMCTPVYFARGRGKARILNVNTDFIFKAKM